MEKTEMRKIAKQSICKRSRIFLAALSAMFFLGSCKSINEEPPVYREKERTLLIYMAANNNLASNAVDNIEQIKSGYIPSEEGNIVAYYHVQGENPLLLNITNGADGTVQIDTAYRFPATNSATAASVVSAMKVTATLFPAKEYGLMLWSHGTGWLPAGYYSNNPERKSAGYDKYASLIKMDRSTGTIGNNTKSFGSEEGKEIDIMNLAKALPYKVSFILFDACLMGGIEVAYELKESTDYILACPTEILAAGFPYSKIMQHIFKSQADLAAVAEEVYEYYAYSTYPCVTISLIKTSELEKVAEAAKPLFNTYREKISTMNISAVQRYYRNNKHWFYDLGSFMTELAGEEATPFLSALDNAIIYKATTEYFLELPIDKNKFYGINTYIPFYPEETLQSYYTSFKWNRDAGMIQTEGETE